jgi:hypothetical protein
MVRHSIILLALSLGFASCENSSDPWYRQEMSTHCKESDSIRLIYPIQEEIEGFELELLFARDELTSHINLFLYPLPPSRRIEYPLTFKTDTETFTYPAYLHQGRQKLTLSKEAQECLLSLLQKESSITLSFSGHSQVILSSGFKKIFDNNLRNYYQLNKQGNLNE